MKGLNNALTFSDEEYTQEVKDLWAIRDGHLADAKLIEQNREMLPFSYVQKKFLLSKIKEVERSLAELRSLAESIPEDNIPSHHSNRFDNLIGYFSGFVVPLRNLMRVIHSLSPEGDLSCQENLQKAKGVEERIGTAKEVRGEHKRILQVQQGLISIVASGKMTDQMRQDIKELATLIGKRNESPDSVRMGEQVLPTKLAKPDENLLGESEDSSGE